MMRCAFIAWLLLFARPVLAADYMLMLNGDNERAALLEILDEAVKAKGLMLAPNAVHFANKIRSAPVVTERKDNPDPPKDQPQ